MDKSDRRWKCPGAAYPPSNLGLWESKAAVGNVDPSRFVNTLWTLLLKTPKLKQTWTALHQTLCAARGPLARPCSSD